MNKRSYIKRKTYLALLKKIRKQCSDLGVVLKIHHRPLIWDRWGGAGPNFGELRGYYSITKKEIMAVFYGKVGYAKKLELLLHELRHAIHHKECLYKDYYQSDWENLKDFSKIKKSQLPCRRNARLAEMDCNKFAYYWLKNEKINIPKDFKYKGDTMADVIHKEFKIFNLKK